MQKEWKEYMGIGSLSFFYILLFTWNIPFYWMDYINIPVFSNSITYNTLSYGFEFYFRPLENITYYIFLHMFGAYTLPLRIFKALFAAGVACSIYYFVKKYTDNKPIAAASSLFFITLSTVLQSVMLIYDFEIVAQFFMLAAVYYFFKAYESEKAGLKPILLFMLLTYLALLTKESTKVFVGTFFAFLLLYLIIYKNWNKLKFFFVASLLLLFIAIKPGILIGLKSPSSGTLLSFFINWFSVHNLFLFFKHFFISCFSVIFLCLYFLYKFVKKENVLFEDSQKTSISFFGIWFCVTVMLTTIVPMGDTRYAIVPLLPFIILSGIFIGNNSQNLLSNMKKIIMCLLVVFVVCNIVLNICSVLKYRYGYGTFFIELHEGYEYIEKNYNNSLIVYTDSIAHFYSSLLDQNNIYIEYPMYHDPNTQSVFFFALQSPLQTKEKNASPLVKTFVKGPQCFMLYEQGKEPITTVSLSNNQYVFSESASLSYCTVELNTRFFIPQDVIVTLVGDKENATIIISPPIGKTKFCEYKCPVFVNNATKAKSIQVTTKNSWLTTISSGSVHYIE